MASTGTQHKLKSTVQYRIRDCSNIDHNSSTAYSEYLHVLHSEYEHYNNNNTTIYRLTDGYSKTLPEKANRLEETLPTPWFADALDSQ
jgi:hypothetical protein